jgi:hypothetical protein
MLERMGPPRQVTVMCLVMCLGLSFLIFSLYGAKAGPCPTYSCGTGTMIQDGGQ